jgi:hypothetical protein
MVTAVYTRMQGQLQHVMWPNPKSQNYTQIKGVGKHGVSENISIKQGQSIRSLEKYA